MIRNLVFQAAVKRKLKKERRRGHLSKTDYKRLKSAATYKASKQILQDTQLKGGDYPILEALWKYVVENWDDILKALIMLASLVLDEE